MANLKTYLNVPFAQKDTVKALGAKWDAIEKKWYVPADKDTAPFASWHTESIGLKPSTATTRGSKTTTSSNKKNASIRNGDLVAVTQPASKDFIAYEGDEPPWD